MEIIFTAYIAIILIAGAMYLYHNRKKKTH